MLISLAPLQAGSGDKEQPQYELSIKTDAKLREALVRDFGEDVIARIGLTAVVVPIAKREVVSVVCKQSSFRKFDGNGKWIEGFQTSVVSEPLPTTNKAADGGPSGTSLNRVVLEFKTPEKTATIKFELTTRTAAGELNDKGQAKFSGSVTWKDYKLKADGDLPSK